MANVAFYKSGEESGNPVATLSSSYSKGDLATQALPVGTYSITYDFIEGNTGARKSSWIYKNVTVHDGQDKDSATIDISSVNAQKK